ncbi:muconolactone Delta-isomerase family protein [Lewinella sp. LCG006]|jgi:muconolactone delta-isomerase|uniref:muconolactone Delta-isomerase family protein n=1 Tax=Lewinella sp. LCG006 TaxID=3231911 RepID=UPI00345FDFD2
MKNAYMVEFELPEEFTEEFMALIPRQRFMINQMLADGIIQNYSLSLDRSRLWAVMVAESEFALMEEIERMPLIDYMVPDISQLMFHNSSMEVMQFSLN